MIYSIWYNKGFDNIEQIQELAVERCLHLMNNTLVVGLDSQDVGESEAISTERL